MDSCWVLMRKGNPAINPGLAQSILEIWSRFMLVRCSFLRDA